MAEEEDPFELIKRGNGFEAASDHWRSAEFYSRASVCLRRRADDLSSQIRNGGANAKEWKVVSLFRAQSLEYMFKARHCFLDALRFENEQDRSRTLEVAKTGTGSLDPLCSMINQEESEKRKLTFQRVFSGGVEAVELKAEVTSDGSQADVPIQSADEIEQNETVLQEIQTSKGNTTSQSIQAEGISDTMKSQNDSGGNAAENSPAGDEICDRQRNIESRLVDLDSSLLPKEPPPFISGSRSNGGDNNQNRLDEIKRGLGRLGVSLPDSGGKSDLLPDKICAEDQVKLIIQQAKDEVRVEKGLHTGAGAESNELVDATISDDVFDENDSMFDDFEDDDCDIDALLAKVENLVAKTGSDADGDGKFSSELVQIKKVQALLLESRLCLEMEHGKSSDEQILPKGLSKTKYDNQEKVDAIEAVSDDSVENDHSTNDPQFVARKKAKELVENAHKCIREILKDWK